MLKKQLTYGATRLGVLLLAMIPFSLLYRVSDLTAFLLRRVFKYRLKVVAENISKVFPGLSEAEKKSIITGAYRNLADILLEGIKGLSMPEQELRKRYVFTNPELIDELSDQYTSVIITGAHFTNWEWAVISLNAWIKAQAVGIYKPVSNRHVEQFLNSRRGKMGVLLVPTEKSRAAFAEAHQQSLAFMLWGDQSPANARNAHWVSFFGQDTAWSHGADSIARQYGLPVVFCETKRVKRGFYSSTYHILSKDPVKEQPQAITEKYVAALSQLIESNPADWLWSHKRWKHSR